VSACRCLAIGLRAVMILRCVRVGGADREGVEVSSAPSSYGVNLKALAVYLLIYQHVPVRRCVQLIADLCGGVGPSDGFVHGMLARCAVTVAEVVAVIRTLITTAYVVGFDETTLRVGPAGQKKYVLCASIEKATVYHLGGRDLGSFAEAGILPGFAGVAVHDRYRNYFHPRWERLAGHQACNAHLFVTSPTPPSPTPTRTGQPKHSARCVA
jgi:transposase